MPEPTSTGVAAIAATISAVTLAVVGVEYYSLLYALVGAMLALGRAEQMTRGRAVVYVLLSTLSGAVMGNAAALYFDKPGRMALFVLCLGGGLLAQVLASALLKAAPGLAELASRGAERAITRIFGGGGKA